MFKVLVYHDQYVRELGRIIRTAFPELAVAEASGPDRVRLELPDADILVATGRGFPGDALGLAGRLKLVQSTAAGVQWLATSPLPEHVQVCRAVGVHAVPTAEHVLAVMLAHANDLRRAWQQQEQRTWSKYPRRTLQGQCLGIAGLGEIGQSVAGRACALGMHVVGLARRPMVVSGVVRVYTRAELPAFLREPDYLVLSLPLTPETRGMFGAPQFAAMKRGAVLINVSRGEVVVGEALLAAVRDGLIAGALLDVFSAEPLPPDSPFWQTPNVAVTPHMAGFIPGAEHYEKLLRENIGRFLDGQALLGLVDRKKGY